MANFHYHSLTSDGEVRTGVLDAVDRADAVRVLLRRGETATRLEAANGEAPAGRGRRRPLRSPPRVAGATGEPAPARRSASDGASLDDRLQRLLSLKSARPGLGRAELATLIRELATALEAGLPLMVALTTVRRQAQAGALPVILDHLIERVESGDPLYLAARDYGPPFDDMVVGMLRAADATGEMSGVMHQLADLLERTLELRREVAGATIYPLIVAGLIVVSTIILVTVLVPRLIGPMTADTNFSLPWPTTVVLGTADFIRAYWSLIIVAAGAGWLGWYLWSGIPANRYRIDLLKLKVPVLGRLLRDIAVARFTRTLGTLSSSGLPLLESLRITSRTLGNAALVRALETVQNEVTSGKSLADPLERTGLFPPLLVQVVGLGERSGRLDKMLMHAAKAFDRQVNTSIGLFTKVLPPVLLIVMASVGGFVLAAILLPLLELQSLVQ